MTIQVAMHGSDGILLAGDTQQRDPLRLRGQYWQEGREGHNSTKIKIDYDQRIAISCAGDMNTSGYIADNLRLAFKANGMSDPIKTIQQIMATVPAFNRTGAKCLVVLPERRLFSVKTMHNIIQNDVVVPEWFPVCQEEQSAAVAGDDISAALFWLEKHYDAINKLPIKQLIPLAAHLVVCAHQLNPKWISGLEIVLCDSDGVNHLSRESIEDLEKKAREWDRTIGNLFASHNPQYTYAPKAKN